MTRKRCTKCCRIRGVRWFGKDSKAPDLLCYWCKECMRTAYNNWVEANRERTYEWQRANRVKRNAEARAWRGRNREKFAAEMAVKYQIRAGKMTRPTSCQRCHRTPPPRRNGVSGIEAHHPDYTKQLEVVWLCRRCHGLAHRKF